MACNNCTKTNPVFECGSTLNLGTTTSDTDIIIEVINTSTGYIHAQEYTTGPYGGIVLDLTIPDTSFYNKDSSYEVRVTDTDGNLLDITIDSVAYECLLLSFKKAYNSDDEGFGIEDQTVTIL